MNDVEIQAEKSTIGDSSTWLAIELSDADKEIILMHDAYLFLLAQAFGLSRRSMKLAGNAIMAPEEVRENVRPRGLDGRCQ